MNSKDFAGTLLLILGGTVLLIGWAFYAYSEWYTLMGITLYSYPYRSYGVPMAVAGVLLVVAGIVVLAAKIEMHQKGNLPPPPALIQRKFCRHCGSENKSDATYCERCGKPFESIQGNASPQIKSSSVPIRFCPKCGQELLLGDTQCARCGRKLET